MSEISMTVGRYHGLTKAHHGVFHQMPEDHEKFIFVTKKHDPEDPRYPLPVKHRESAIREVAPEGTSIVPVNSAFHAFDHAVNHARENNIDTVNVHVGDDRAPEMNRIADHKDFKGININVRTIDRSSLGGHSGTALRDAARTGNTEMVGDMMAPVSNKTKKEFIKHMQNTNENFDYENIPDWFNLEEFYAFADAYQGVQELLSEQEMTKEKPVTRQMKLDNARSNPDGDETVDRDRKRTDRASSRDKMKTNPWPELAVVRTTQDGKLRIIPKADFSYKKHELVTGNIKGLPPRGEVTPQTAFGVMQEPDFEQSKTSKRLIQMFGLDSPHMGGGQVAPEGQAISADPEAAPMNPLMMEPPPEPPRLPPDGKEITGKGSINPDWDHSVNDLDAGIVHAWNSATNNNPFSGLLGDPDLNKIGESETLESAGFRAIEKLMEKVPPNFEAIMYTPGQEKLSREWEQVGGINAMPTTSIYFKPKGKKDTAKETIKATMKIGMAKLLMNPIEDGPPIFNAIAMTEIGQTITQDSKVKKFVKDTTKKLNESFINLAAIQAKTERDKKKTLDELPEIAEAEKMSNEISSKIENIFTQDKNFKKQVTREALTGELKFGPDALASSNSIISGNKDGTNTNLTPITDEYIEMISKIPKMMLAFKSPSFDLDAPPTEVEMQTYNYRTALQMQMGRQQPVTMEQKKINLKNMISLKEYNGSDYDSMESEPTGYGMSDHDPDIQRYDDVSTNYTEPTYTGQFRDYGTGNSQEYIRAAIENIGDDVYKLMEFMQLGVESIDTEPIDFTEYTMDKSTKYNKIDINGRTIKIPIDPNYEMITNEEVEYIDTMFDFIILEKNRNYRKEYDNYHSKQEQRENRVKRVLARRKKEKQVGKEALADQDVDHKEPLRNGGSNDDSNLRIRSRSANRSDNGQKKQVKEEHGAGFEGTQQLLHKYLKQTPGQCISKKKVKNDRKTIKK
jgi:hypothetical protein